MLVTVSLEYGCKIDSLGLQYRWVPHQYAHTLNRPFSVCQIKAICFIHRCVFGGRQGDDGYPVDQELQIRKAHLRPSQLFDDGLQDELRSKSGGKWLSIIHGTPKAGKEDDENVLTTVMANACSIRCIRR